MKGLLAVQAQKMDLKQELLNYAEGDCSGAGRHLCQGSYGWAPKCHHVTSGLCAFGIGPRIFEQVKAPSATFSYSRSFPREACTVTKWADLLAPHERFITFLLAVVS